MIANIRAVVVSLLVAVLVMLVGAEAQACGGYGPMLNEAQLSEQDRATYVKAREASNDAWDDYADASAALEKSRAHLADLTAKNAPAAELKAAQAMVDLRGAEFAKVSEIANKRSMEFYELETKLAEEQASRQAAATHQN